MHPYAVDTDERQRVFIFLALVSVGLAWLSNWVLTTFHVTIPWYLEAPSVLSIYGILVWGFNQFVWRWRIFRFVQLVKTPDLSGAWEGYIESSFYHYQQRQHVTVKIQQTWTKMCIEFDTGKMGSRSHSQIAGILMDYPGGPLLSYNYLNEPQASATETMQTHRGTTVLNIRNNHLEGQYYSGRGRMSLGNIELRRTAIS